MRIPPRPLLLVLPLLCFACDSAGGRDAPKNGGAKAEAEAAPKAEPDNPDAKGGDMGAAREDAGTCVPGRTVECACPGGVKGIQHCAQKGTYDACECPGAAPQAPDDDAVPEVPKHDKINEAGLTHAHHDEDIPTTESKESDVPAVAEAIVEETTYTYTVGEACHAAAKKSFGDCVDGAVVDAFQRRATKQARKWDGLMKSDMVQLRAQVVTASDGSKFGFASFEIPYTEDFDDGLEFVTSCVGVWEQLADEAKTLNVRWWHCGDVEPAVFHFKDVVGDGTPELMVHYEDFSAGAQRKHSVYGSHPKQSHWRVIASDLGDCEGEKDDDEEPLAFAAALYKGEIRTYCNPYFKGGKARTRDVYQWQKVIFVRKGDAIGMAEAQILDDDRPGAEAAKIAMDAAKTQGNKAKDPISRAANTRGYRLYHVGKIDDALPLFEASASIDPEYKYAHYNLARVHATKGDATAAVKHLTALMTLSSKHAKLVANAAVDPGFAKVKDDAAFKALMETANRGG